MGDLLTIFEIGVILLSVIMQFIISSNSKWRKKQKYIVSISMFLVMFTLNIGVHIIIGYLPYTPINGIVLVFLMAWTVIISAIAGALQIITAIVVWLFKRIIDKKQKNEID